MTLNTAYQRLPTVDDVDAEPSPPAEGSIPGHGSIDSALLLGRQPTLPSPSDAAAAPKTSLYPYVPILCGLLCVVVDLAGGARAASEVRLFELAICRQYYKLHDPSKIGPPPFSYVDERDCKVSVIQSDLAYFRAWKDIFLMIPGEGYS